MSDLRTDADAALIAHFEAEGWVVVPDEWTPDSGEVTPSLKMKRRVVLDRYADEIESMYSGV